MCESVIILHYNKEKHRGITWKICVFSWRLSDICTKEHFIQSKIHKKNESESVHIRQYYSKNHRENKETTRDSHKLYKKRK